MKFDGYRLGVAVVGGRSVFTSRNGNDWSQQFPTLSGADAELRVGAALLDGEVVVLRPDGGSDFHALQSRRGKRSPELAFYAFDLLHLDGTDLRPLALSLRRERLAALLPTQGGVIRFSDHFDGDGASLLAAACKAGAEGIVSKRSSAPYRPGRNRDWLKTKCVQRRLFVVGGYLVSPGAPLAALLLGYYDGAGAFRYAGKVGTGFQSEERELLRALERAPAAVGAFSEAARPKGRDFREARWVCPQLVVAVEFLEWTADVHLRHATFRGVVRGVAVEDVTGDR